MKKNTRIIWITLTTLFIIIMSQQALFASDSSNSGSGSSLGTFQIVGAIGLVLLAFILPLVRSSRKEISHK